MPGDPDDEKEMKMMLLQEAVWNNGEMIGRVLEHVIAHEMNLLRLIRQVELVSQRLGILTNGNKQQPHKDGKR